MATRGFPFFLVFLSAHGFLLDKTQRTSGLSGTSNQYMTASELFGETKTRQLEDQQLRHYIDNAFAVLTSQLEHKFDALDQKFIRCEHQSVHSQANGTLEQKYIDLERKHTDLDRKYMDLEKKYIQMQSMNNDKFYLLKKHFLTIQNKTSEISNDVNTLKQLGHSKPLQEIQTLQQQFTAISAQVQSLTVIERVHRLDFLALYNTTIEQKIALGALNITGSSNQLVKLTEIQTNNSKQLLRLGELETKTSKELVRLEELESNTSKQLLRLVQNHNSTTAGIISKIEAMENQKNKTMSVMQKQINKNSLRVAMTAHPSFQGMISNAVIKFDDVRFSVGITNLATYKTTGKFTCEQEGLYIISASVMSHTSNAHYYINLNGNHISQTYIGQNSNGDVHTGAVTVTWKLNLNDQVWLYADGSWYLYVATTAHPSHTGTISNTIIKFDDVKFSVGITNLTKYKSTGKFTCEQEGLYLISASVMSNTNGAYYYISLNGNYISKTNIGDHSSTYAQTGAVTVTRKLNPNDQVWLYASGSWYLYGGLYSKLSIIKIK